MLFVREEVPSKLLKSDSHVQEIFAKLKFSPALFEKNTIICLFGV